jgi:cellulose biosynthesis protein BcsQ
MQSIAFFNHKGGVGKTTMLFNIAIEMGRLGKRVLLVDFDAQANLTAIALDDVTLESLYSPGADGMTVAHAFAPLVSGAGDVSVPDAIEVRENQVWLLPGDITLSAFEEILPSSWTEALAGTERGFRITSAPYRLWSEVGAALNIDYVFLDLGPNVGPMNRSVLIGADYLVVPMASDLFSLRALPSVGQSLKTWVSQWHTANAHPVAKALAFATQEGHPKLLGYVSQQFNVYRGDPTLAFQNWIRQTPALVEKGLLAPLREFDDGKGGTLADPADQNDVEMGTLKNYHSLVPHAQSLRQAIFEMEQDEIILANQLTRARASEDEFRALAEQIIKRTAD